MYQGILQGAAITAYGTYAGAGCTFEIEGKFAYYVLLLGSFGLASSPEW